MTAPDPSTPPRGFRTHWARHPGVRSGEQLTPGERAADAMRNGMGSWTFVFAALLFLALWMGYNRSTGFDKYPFILLNLVLSCLAALQGAILLIAAKRQDSIASQLAQHDYDTNVHADAHIDLVLDRLSDLQAQHAELRREHRELLDLLQAGPPPAGRG